MDILVVGASVIDLFLKIESDEHTKVTDGKVTFALGDKVPIHIRKLAVGGNGANVSVGLKRLGIDTSFFTYFGSDILSSEIEKTLANEGIKLYVKRKEEGHSSLSLIFSFETDRIIFSHHEKMQYDFNYSDPTPKLIYLTAIGEDWQTAFRQVLDYSIQHAAPIAFSPGSYQLNTMDSLFFDILKRSQMIFINKEEAMRILDKIGAKYDTISDILKEIHSLGPQLVSVTDGEHGAYASDIENAYKIGTIPETIVERTGAGDSYAAGFIAGYTTHNIQIAMKWGVLEASAIMQHVGAQTGLLTTEQMEEKAKEYQSLQAEKL